jgi:hypothetical protein
MRTGSACRARYLRCFSVFLFNMATAYARLRPPSVTGNEIFATVRTGPGVTGSRHMIDEARVKRMIDVADELIEELADRGFDAAESGVVLSLAAIQTAKALGRNKVEIVDGLGVLCDLCRVATGIQVS